MAYRAFIPLQRNQITVPFPHLTTRLTTKILSRSPGIRKLATQTLTSNFNNLSLITSTHLLIFSQRRGFAEKSVVSGGKENIDSVQRDLLRIINNELRELQNDDFDPQEFLQRTKFELQEKDNVVKMSKNADNSTVDISFKLPNEEEEEEHEPGAPADYNKNDDEETDNEKETDNKEKDEETEEEEEEQDTENPPIDKLKDFNVVVTR